jgi:hypothetical protein
VVCLTFDSFEVDPRDIWSEESTCGERTLRGASLVGDEHDRGSSGGRRSSGKRDVDADDS